MVVFVLANCADKEISESERLSANGAKAKKSAKSSKKSAKANAKSALRKLTPASLTKLSQSEKRPNFTSKTSPKVPKMLKEQPVHLQTKNLEKSARSTKTANMTVKSNLKTADSAFRGPESSSSSYARVEPTKTEKFLESKLVSIIPAPDDDA